MTAMAAVTKSGGKEPIASPPATAASPPTTSAPSPPIITSPSRAGTAVQRAVSISGAARRSVFCTENEVPNEPRYIW